MSAGHYFRVWRQPIWACWHWQDGVSEGSWAGIGKTGMSAVIGEGFRSTTVVVSQPHTDLTIPAKHAC